MSQEYFIYKKIKKEHYLNLQQKYNFENHFDCGVVKVCFENPVCRVFNERR